MTKALQRRVTRIEARQRPATWPLWLAVPTVDDLPAALAAMPDGWRCTCYVHVSPDDWDGAP